MHFSIARHVALVTLALGTRALSAQVRAPTIPAGLHEYTVRGIMGDNEMEP